MRACSQIVANLFTVPSWLVGDAIRRRQLPIHLVSNASKFPQRDEVALERAGSRAHQRSTTAANDAVVLHFRVRDTGIGITDGVIIKRATAFPAHRQRMLPSPAVLETSAPPRLDKDAS